MQFSLTQEEKGQLLLRNVKESLAKPLRFMTLGSSCFFVAVIEPCDQGSQGRELTLAYGSRAIRIREHTAEAGGSGRKPRAHILNQKNKPERVNYK